MARYLLDTNILSELERNPRGAVAKRIAQVGQERVCTSIIAAADDRESARRPIGRLAKMRLPLLVGDR